jgi:hypothetical protein
VWQMVRGVDGWEEDELTLTWLVPIERDGGSYCIVGVYCVSRGVWCGDCSFRWLMSWQVGGLSRCISNEQFSVEELLTIFKKEEGLKK